MTLKTGSPASWSQADLAESHAESGSTDMFPRTTDWIGREPAAEAKKAGSASGDTLLTPRPPILIEREAYAHWSSVSDAFRISSRPARSSSSKVTQARVTMAGGASQYVHEPRRAERVAKD